VRGFEIEALGKITPELKILAAYTFMDAKWESCPDPLSVKAGTQVEGAPKHMASLCGIYSFSNGPLSGLSLGAGVRYVGSVTDVASEVHLPPIENARVLGQFWMASAVRRVSGRCPTSAA